ncbi:MAG: hypothetical protein ACPGUD_09240 [Parashewanella sp.]
MKTLSGVLVTISSLLVIACNDTGFSTDLKIKNSITQNGQTNGHYVTGTVIEKSNQGRDGSVWKFQAQDGQTYSLVVSIPNLGKEQSKNIKLVKPANCLSIKGDSYTIDKKIKLIARQISVCRK